MASWLRSMGSTSVLLALAGCLMLTGCSGDKSGSDKKGEDKKGENTFLKEFVKRKRFPSGLLRNGSARRKFPPRLVR